MFEIVCSFFLCFFFFANAAQHHENINRILLQTKLDGRKRYRYYKIHVSKTRRQKQIIAAANKRKRDLQLKKCQEENKEEDVEIQSTECQNLVTQSQIEETNTEV